jgi:8-oxo-dGTP pyrophosphatase MutT (NUDIX family)
MNYDKSNWEILSTESGPNLKLFDVEYEYLKHKTSGHETKVVRLNSADSCNVIAITPDQKVVMTRQFRFGVNYETLEIPGGFVEAGEDPADAVKRELEEETGYVSDQWIYLGKMPSNPVFQNSFIHHYVAYDAKAAGTVNWDDSEEIELEFVPVSEIKNGLLSGKFEHPHTVSAFVFLPDL